MSKKVSHPVADQFSDDEMAQMKRYGQAQLGGTDFSAEVEKELVKLQRKREANAGKMKATQTGGSLRRGPTGNELGVWTQRRDGDAAGG